MDLKRLEPSWLILTARDALRMNTNSMMSLSINVSNMSARSSRVVWDFLGRELIPPEHGQFRPRRFRAELHDVVCHVAPL